MTTRTWGNLSPTLAEFKAHIRITTTDMDLDLTGKLTAAVRSAEHFIGQVIVPSTFKYTGPFAKTITLEDPVTAVSSVMVDGEPIQEEDWSLTGDVLTIDAEGSTVEVNYSAGMAAVEPDIKAAILLHAAALFENPVDSVETLPKASSRLLAPYRTWGVQ